MTKKHICGLCQKVFDSLEEYENHKCKKLGIKPKNRGKVDKNNIKVKE